MLIKLCRRSKRKRSEVVRDALRRQLSLNLSWVEGRLYRLHFRNDRVIAACAGWLWPHDLGDL